MSAAERRRRAQKYPDADAVLAENCEELLHEPAMSAPQEQLPEAGAPAPLPCGVMATNTGVRLACTMAAMIGLFAVFLCWAERESRVIRRFAVQSAALTAVHAVAVAAVLLLGVTIGGVPYLGLLMTLLSWLCYIAALIVLVVARVRLMKRAWQGVRFDMPAPIERMLQRFY